LARNAARGVIEKYETKYGHIKWYGILEKNEIFVTRKKLSKLLNCYPQTASKILDFLEDNGLIEFCILKEKIIKKQIIDITVKVKRPPRDFIKIYEEDFKKFDPKTQSRTFYVYCWLVKTQVLKEKKPYRRKHGRGYVEIDLHPGQLIVGRYLTSKLLNMKPEAFRRCLDTLEKMDLIRKRVVKYYYTIVQIQATREGYPEIIYRPLNQDRIKKEETNEQSKEEIQDQIEEFENEQTEPFSNIHQQSD